MSEVLTVADVSIAAPPGAEPPAALVVLPGGRCGFADDRGSREVDAAGARRMLESASVLLAHAAMSFRRLDLPAPPRSPRLLDALELFAFVRPADFCAPSAAGLALALGLAEPKSAAEQAAALRDIAARLLAELAGEPRPGRAEALAIAETLGRAGWAWAPAVLAALAHAPPRRPWRGGGLDVWARLPQWRESAPPGLAGAQPLQPIAAELRLATLLGRLGLDEARPAQATYAREAAHAFQPREREDEPMTVLAEAGTGIGKTLAYLAPASLWAEAHGGAVWISTYTKALQRQIERQSHAVYPHPPTRAAKAVVRKGRENYLCLLNYQEAVNAAQLGGGDLIGLALAARWIRASRDGDMAGGDFPAWLTGLFAVGACGAGRACGISRPAGRMRPRRLPALRRLFHRKGGARVASRRTGDRQPRPGDESRDARQRALAGAARERWRSRPAAAAGVRRRPSAVRRRGQRLFGCPVRRRGGRPAPLGARSRDARAARSRAGNPARRSARGP